MTEGRRGADLVGRAVVCDELRKGVAGPERLPRGILAAFLGLGTARERGWKPLLRRRGILAALGSWARHKEAGSLFYSGRDS